MLVSNDSPALQRVLDALEQHGCKPRRSGDGWTAFCPAHEADGRRHSPSLSVTQADSGKVLICCHANKGCSTDAIVKALGLRLRDLFSDPGGNHKPTTPKATKSYRTPLEAMQSYKLGDPSMKHPYRDADGKLVGVVYRWDGPHGKEIRPVAVGEDGRWYPRQMKAPRPLYRLPELLAADPSALVLVCEGEKAADAVAELGLIGTTSSGGSKAAGKTDWSPLAGRTVWIVPDNDPAGESYAQDVARLCHQAGAREVRILHWSNILPGRRLPGGYDLADALVECAGDSEALAELCARIDRAAEQTKPWKPDPADLPPPLPVWQPFPTDVFPTPARRLIEAAARSIRVDPAMIAVPCLVTMTAAIGGARVVRVKEGWSEPAVLWAGVVARSGEQKSPPLEIATEPLAEAEQRLAAADPDQRVVVRDVTIESLADKLKDSPRGLVLVRDELAGWFDGFRRYRNHGSDAPAWIECFHGRRLVVDRVQRGTARIRRAVVSVVGTIQPGIFRNHASPALVESGLIPRLLLVMPPRRPRRWSDAELPQSVTAGWAELIGRLFDLPMPVDDYGDPAPAVSDLAPEARGLFREWVNGLGAEIDRADDTLAAMLSKLEGYVARFALVLHLARWAAGEQVDPARIDGESMTRAVRLGWWFRNELERVAGLLLADPEDAERQELVDWIRQRGGVVTPRELKAGCWRFRRLPTSEIEAELGRLVEAGLGRWEKIPTTVKGGRPTRRFVLAQASGSDSLNTLNINETPQKLRENEGFVDVDVVDTVQSQAVVAPWETDDRRAEAAELNSGGYGL